ncbi:MAG: hypothetical protein K2X87_23755 [Gemmataceae bacterium]|nr:hypothetical protein [Gemmataceae bacterium]
MTRRHRVSAVVAGLLVAAAVAAGQDPPARDPLDRPLDPEPPARAEPEPVKPASVADFVYPPTPGFAGPSGVLPRSGSNAEYDTVEDRWRIGLPGWDRYGLGHPRVFDYPYQLGRWFDPYRLNVLKGDYPILGQHTFLNVSGAAAYLNVGRAIPTATTPFESTARPFTTDFFGRPGQYLHNELYTVSFDLFHGDAAFKPADWRVKLAPAFNVNALSVQELAVVSPDVRDGTIRNRTWGTLQEWFAEYKLADLSPEYDFVSVRAGSQPFVSDFRGFIFADVNRGVRLFGNYDGNRTQYNLAYFRQQEKDTNSGLNTFEDRNQNIAIANVYRQDFIFPGYTAQASFHYNNDGPDVLYDKNGFLVRPDPVGVFQPHRVEAYYLGLAGDGHIGRYNVSHALYWALGRDSRNPLAGTPQSISAQLAAVELSYDRDWARFRVSGMWQSGDGNVNNGRATGFDGILDNTNFGGEFSYWRTNRIPLFGVGLTNDQSQYVDLRSSRIQGQSNFVNPGLWLINMGVDFDITPRFRVVNNANYLFFDKTNVLETFVYQGNIGRDIGLDLSTGFEWRPRLNNQAVILGGVSGLLPGGGFRQLYNRFGSTVSPLGSVFLEVVLAF